MKFIAVLLAFLMLAGGVYMIISGYELKNSTYSKAENVISQIFKGSSGKTSEDANIRMIIGAVLAFSGLLTLIKVGQSPKDKSDKQIGSRE